MNNLLMLSFNSQTADNYFSAPNQIGNRNRGKIFSKLQLVTFCVTSYKCAKKLITDKNARSFTSGTVSKAVLGDK